MLLAGTVCVELVGRNLVVRGDQADNSIVIHGQAESAADLVEGIDGTDVEFSRRVRQEMSLDRLHNLHVVMRGGNDTVLIRASGAELSGGLTVSLGTGDDVFAVVGNELEVGRIRKNLLVRGQGGDDSVLISDLEVGGSLKFVGSAGRDAAALERVQVERRTVFVGRDGDDSLLVDESRFANNVVVGAGRGDDYLGLADSDFAGHVVAHGQAGHDVVFADPTTSFVRQPNVRSAEQQSHDPNADGRTTEAASGLIDGFTDTAPELPTDLANDMQDSLADLADAFDFDLVSLDVDPVTQRVTVSDPTPTVSVMWDDIAQRAVVNTSPGPTIASRAYGILHTAMFDAWSAYDGAARSTQLGDDLQRPATENTDANKREAMSYAAHRVLDDLFASQTALFDEQMERLGYDADDQSTDTTTPAGIGNVMADAVLAFRQADGSNQKGDSPFGTAGVPYSDTSGYTPAHSPGVTTDIERWTPEFVPIDAEPASEGRTQRFLTPHWGTVTPFALTSGSGLRPAEPEPFLLVDGVVDLAAQTITLADSTVLNIDASLVGTVINPAFIAQAEDVVEYSANLTDEQKLIAEFWEDAGGTAFPPGTFMTFGEFVSARDNHSLDDDAQMFLALGNAVFDAGVVTWEAKTHYDYTRPVRAIRELGQLGLIGEFNADLNGFAIDAWTREGGTQTILATDFLTYQTPGRDPSPPFSEYTSGHSAFSAAGATVLRLFTGSDDFGGSVTFGTGTSRFEPGTTPAAPVTLSWDTFTTAAEEAGFSRLYGGIHFSDGNVRGTQVGVGVGEAVWARVQSLINGEP